MRKIGLFAAGVLFGTVGIKLLSSKDARKAYAHTTAAALRAKDCVMTKVTAVREGADDIYAEAKAINERRAEAEAAAVVEDASAEDAKKVYARTTAAALRAKEGVMKAVTAVREGAEDVYADAKAINECRAEAEAAAVVEDASAEESKAE